MFVSNDCETDNDNAGTHDNDVGIDNGASGDRRVGIDRSSTVDAAAVEEAVHCGDDDDEGEDDEEDDDGEEEDDEDAVAYPAEVSGNWGPRGSRTPGQKVEHNRQTLEMRHQIRVSISTLIAKMTPYMTSKRSARRMNSTAPTATIRAIQGANTLLEYSRIQGSSLRKEVARLQEANATLTAQNHALRDIVGEGSIANLADLLDITVTTTSAQEEAATDEFEQNQKSMHAIEAEIEDDFATAVELGIVKLIEREMAALQKSLAKNQKQQQAIKPKAGPAALKKLRTTEAKLKERLVRFEDKLKRDKITADARAKEAKKASKDEEATPSKEVVKVDVDCKGWEEAYDKENADAEAKLLKQTNPKKAAAERWGVKFWKGG